MFDFKKEIVGGCFFYVDKFFLLGIENKLLLCKYFVDTEKCDIQRYLNSTYTELVSEQVGKSKITTLSAVNSFYSYIVITADSDQAIQIYDMNVGKCCLTINEAHSYSMHQICQNTSQFNQNSYDLFLTNSVGDGVKMWDLRTKQCVNHFDAHINRCLPTKVSFSPDSNYVAIGSEDRSAFVYDLRFDRPIQKYGTFSDSVTSSQFNPCGSQVNKLLCLFFFCNIYIFLYYSLSVEPEMDSCTLTTLVSQKKLQIRCIVTLILRLLFAENLTAINRITTTVIKFF